MEHSPREQAQPGLVAQDGDALAPGDELCGGVRCGGGRRGEGEEGWGCSIWEMGATEGGLEWLLCFSGRGSERRYNSADRVDNGCDVGAAVGASGGHLRHEVVLGEVRSPEGLSDLHKGGEAACGHTDIRGYGHGSHGKSPCRHNHNCVCVLSAFTLQGGGSCNLRNETGNGRARGAFFLTHR